MEYRYNTYFNVLDCNSNICISLGLVSVDFSHFDYVLLSANLRVDARHYEFYLVGCWYFFIPIKYLWGLSWGAFKLHGNNLVLLYLAFMVFVEEFWSSGWSNANQAPLLRQDLSDTLLNSPWFMSFSICLVEQILFPSLYEHFHFLILLNSFFLPDLGSFLKIGMGWSLLDWICRGLSTELGSSFL